MSREILFRAKRIDNGEWVEGNLITNERNECKKYIGYIFDERNGVIEDFDIVEVIPNMLCQYTGLKDKNGNKIWENDIVKHEISDTLGTVKWYQEDYVGWCVDDVMIDEQQFTDEMWNECEVIGNAFDDKHLLDKSDYCREQGKETED